MGNGIGLLTVVPGLRELPEGAAPRPVSPRGESCDIEPYKVVGVPDLYDLAELPERQGETVAPWALMLSASAAVEEGVQAELQTAVAAVDELKETVEAVSDPVSQPIEPMLDPEVTAQPDVDPVPDVAEVIEHPEPVAANEEPTTEKPAEPEPVTAMVGPVESAAAPVASEPPVVTAIAEAVPVVAAPPAVVETVQVAVTPPAEAGSPPSEQPKPVEAPATMQAPAEAQAAVEAQPEPEAAASVPADHPVTLEPVISVSVSDAAGGSSQAKRGFTSFALARSIGIYLTEERLVWSIARKLALGGHTLETFEQKIARADWRVGVAHVLERHFGGKKKKKTPVVLGLPASHIFFATLPRTGAKDESAQSLLAAHHCCSSIPSSELACDLVGLKVGAKQYASVAAGRSKEVGPLADVVRQAQMGPVRVEPAPWALLRLTTKGKLPKSSLRLFVNGRELVAILAQGAHPLLWKTMELSQSGAEAADAILSLVRTFETYATQHLGMEDIPAIALQGENMPPRLAERLQAEIGAKFMPIDGPGPTPQAISQGLALGALQWEQPALDLGQSLAPPPGLRELVPVQELSVMGAVVLCSALWLWMSGNDAMGRARRAEEANNRNIVLKQSDAALQQEKTTLSAEVQAVSKFLSNRVMWTEYMSQFAMTVPPGVRCLSIDGNYELSTGAEKNEKKIKRSLQMELASNLPSDVSAPPEVNQVLASVRESAVITREFPEIKLGTLRVSKKSKRGPNGHRQGDGTDPATFIVNCLPRSKAPAGGAGAAGAAPAAGGADAKEAKPPK